eukprot:CAMPEP_0206232124 /NCGR_PEP_ID=MMETSP0047_2-20121206/11240_1 /ASSEMBLY_ACC=CAM_ASM_000192 /TAXON_ID=195065 /ORGANISM="Chroomonas mesostigmatica_cf, Strain CCMP1168" /LENGTH=161 /DNA_ID=CAMNT_0053655823 /DNA_START=48 /DNA_END=533 /DNA_ORIENTATION=+
MNAVKGGAERVTAVDSSQPALALAAANAARNGCEGAIEFVHSDVQDFLGECVREKRTFDIVVLDPPKLAPSRKDLERAKGRYRKLNKAALQCVAPGGLLITCTCSSAMAQTSELLGVVRAAASECSRQVTVVRTSGAACDHPVSPSFPEGTYLQAYWVAVS